MSNGGYVKTILVFAFCVYALMPIFYLVLAATKSATDIYSTFGLWFGRENALWTNLQELFSARGGIFLVWMRNSLFYSLSISVFATAFATSAAYAFSKFEFPGRRVLYGVTLGAVMVPATVTVMPLYLLMADIGLLGSPLSIILPQLVFPLGVFLMKAYIDEAISNELIDAARIDGAGEGRIFVSIVLRLVVPGMVTVLLLTFVASWNNFFLPLVMVSDSGQMPVTVGLAGWFQQANVGGQTAEVRVPTVFAGAMIGTFPTVLLFLFMQRFWQGGLGAGGVKA